MLGSFMTELQAAVAPFFSEPLAGEIPLFTGCPSLRPSGVAVLRHKNGKWYAVIMNVERSKLGLAGDDTVEIIDVKCDPEMTGMIIQTYGFLPGHHMNKQHWITILLDGTVGESKILDFLDMSYELIENKK